MVLSASSQKPRGSRVFVPNLASSSEIVNFKLCQQQSNWCCSGWSHTVFSYRECTTTFLTTLLDKESNIKLSQTTNFLNKSNKSFWAQLYPFGKVFFSEVQSGYRTWFFGVFLYALWILVRSPGWLTRMTTSQPWISPSEALDQITPPGTEQNSHRKNGLFQLDASKSLHEKNGWTSPFPSI